MCAIKFSTLARHSSACAHVAAQYFCRPAIVSCSSPQYIITRYNKPGSCYIPLGELVGAERRETTAYVTSLIKLTPCIWGSSVGIVTRLGAGRSKDCGSTPDRNKRFVFCKASRSALGPTQPDLQSGTNRPGREAGHSPPSNARIKNAWTYISTPPYTFMVFTGTSLSFFLLNLPWQIISFGKLTISQLVKIFTSSSLQCSQKSKSYKSVHTVTTHLLQSILYP